ncbi:MAG: hypothetical protein ABMA13_07960 [Chthoniobacteraceae bacterium]
MKTATPRKFALILGVAFAALLATPDQAQAGTKEVVAIANQLNPGSPLTTKAADVIIARQRILNANTTDLSNAVIGAIGFVANNKLNPGIIAGEALKGAGAGAPTIGDQLAMDIRANLGNANGTFPKINLDVAKFAGTAALTAATSIGANPAQIPAFIAEFTENPPGGTFANAFAIAIAKAAAKSTTAVGAILGGRALNPDFLTDLDLIDLANQAITEKALAKSSQQIAQYVSETAVDAADFALKLAVRATNTKFIIQIATGTTVSNPGDAALIVDGLFNANQLASPVYLAAVKNSTKMASSVALVASAEQVQPVAVAFSSRIGLVNPATGKVVGISQKSVAALTKALVLGLTNRPTQNMTTNGDNRTNRIDEIGEIAAYLLNGIKTLPDFQGTDNAGVPLVGSKLTAAVKRSVALVTSLVKTAISSAAKVHRDVAGGELVIPTRGTTVKAPIFQATVAGDVAGSVALTLNSLGAGAFGPGVFQAIVNALTLDPKIGTKVAGSSKTLFNLDGTPRTIGDVVKVAFAAGINNTGNASMIYEDGTMAANAIDVVMGAETDVRSR